MRRRPEKGNYKGRRRTSVSFVGQRRKQSKTSPYTSRSPFPGSLLTFCRLGPLSVTGTPGAREQRVDSGVVATGRGVLRMSLSGKVTTSRGHRWRLKRGPKIPGWRAIAPLHYSEASATIVSRRGGNSRRKILLFCFSFRPISVGAPFRRFLGGADGHGEC